MSRVFGASGGPRLPQIGLSATAARLLLLDRGGSDGAAGRGVRGELRLGWLRRRELSWARLSDAYPDSPPQAVCIDDQRCTDCAAHPVAACEREPLLAISAAYNLVRKWSNRRDPHPRFPNRSRPSLADAVGRSPQSGRQRGRPGPPWRRDGPLGFREPVKAVWSARRICGLVGRATTLRMTLSPVNGACAPIVSEHGRSRTAERFLTGMGCWLVVTAEPPHAPRHETNTAKATSLLIAVIVVRLEWPRRQSLVAWLPSP